MRTRAGLFAAKRILLDPLRRTTTERDLLRSEHDAMHAAGLLTDATVRAGEPDLRIRVSGAAARGQVLRYQHQAVHRPVMLSRQPLCRAEPDLYIAMPTATAERYVLGDEHDAVYRSGLFT
jgi:hypothetical protein